MVAVDVRITGTGARNPYALAELIQKRRINWRSQSFDRSMEKLENAFGMPADRIFNPRYNSLLFSDPIGDTIDAEAETGTDGTVTGTISSAVWANLPGGKYTINSERSGTDPVQSGIMKNCSLISALASCAWVKKASLVTEDQPRDTIHPFSYDIYDITKGWIRVCPSAGLLQSPLGTLVHASSSTPYETWPSILEKAYYMSRSVAATGASTDKPDYTLYANDTNNPITVLRQVTGVVPGRLTKAANPDVYTPENIFARIAALSPGLAGYTKIRHPAIAWTGKVPAVYDGTIAPRHSYSILGVAGDCTQVTRSTLEWKNKYIVLRNPWGAKPGDPTAFAGNALYTATDWCTMKFTTNDGIFALRADLFYQYFDGFAWAVIA